MAALLLTTLLACGDLCDDDAIRHYAHLLQASGYGRLPNERAAFLIREADGSITGEPWQHSGFQHAVFRGSVPARAIAIAHTHPRSARNPSALDREEARRTGLPVVVVTPSGVVAAMPDGKVLTVIPSIARNPAGWWRTDSTAERTPALF